MAGNDSFARAKSVREDKFYTQLTDIEKEMRHYRKHFKDKTVLCNCDDPFESNFFKYFVLNFNRLGLKKLIATCYTGSPIANRQLSIFDIIGETQETYDKPYKAVVTTVYDKTGDGGVDMFDVAELFKSGENELTELAGDGDFRSPECLALMDEAEILSAVWIQSHDSSGNEPPFEYPLKPLFSNRYRHRKSSEPLPFVSCPERSIVVCQ